MSVVTELRHTEVSFRGIFSVLAALSLVSWKDKPQDVIRNFVLLYFFADSEFQHQNATHINNKCLFGPLLPHPDGHC